MTHLHFSKILFMEHKAKNSCEAVISGEAQIWNFHTLLILYVHFRQIQYFFKVFKNR